jgi:hypothetical protein
VYTTAQKTHALRVLEDVWDQMCRLTTEFLGSPIQKVVVCALDVVANDELIVRGKTSDGENIVGCVKFDDIDNTLKCASVTEHKVLESVLSCT